MESSKAPGRSRWEWLAVAVVTVIGFGLRSWPVGRLGLNHFDEGIYALAASWSLLPKGLAGLDPSLIPYAPPGYPILGGIAYAVLGRSDGAMIAVSQIAGTLTIPVVAWLGRRTFGPGAGFASATFCAFSGPHIAFSRMALTDASFLLAWLLALGAGMRFLERPGLVRAVVMGLAVGMAQEFKYNGWLAGGIVMASAVWGILVRPEERKLASILKTFGWGILAAGVAWLVVWPWFAYVEAHGGYSALLRHQQGYLGGFRDWWPNLMIQADQAMALSGGDQLLLFAVVFAGASSWIERAWPRRERGRLPSWLFQVVMMALAILFPWLLSPAPYWLGLVMAPWLMIQDCRSSRLLGVWWLVLSLMTPFYHPYARLWLPYHAANWILMGWLVTRGPAVYFSYRSRMGATRSGRWTLGLAMAASLGLYALGGVVAVPRLKPGPWATVGRLLKPSDSLYRATFRVAQVLPDSVKGLRLLARPAVTSYLAGRVTLYPMANSEALGQPGDPNIWALVDSAILVSEPGRNPIERLAKDWEIVETIRTNPGLPTIFDLDPYAARATAGDWSYPLWLLRPRTSKAPK